MIIENGIRHIAVYGDSILKGAITGTGSGNLFDITENDSLLLASRALDFELTNRSVFGSTAVKTCRRLMRDLNNGMNAELVIIESGGNDCDYDWAPVSATPDAPHTMQTDIDNCLEIQVKPHYTQAMSYDRDFRLQACSK